MSGRPDRPGPDGATEARGPGSRGETGTPRLSIVLAFQGGSLRLSRVLAALEAQCRDAVEVLLCHPEGYAGIAGACRGRPWLTPVRGAPDSLVPHLWRDGILRARAPRIALTVMHCRPGPAWVERLLAADLERFAAVGGAIENDPNSDACGWAVHLLRYSRYGRASLPRETGDLPGDNVVYDRDVLLPLADLFADGFWEPTIHDRLRRDGRRLFFDPALFVIHDNGYRFGEFLRLRFAHGRRYGRDRAASMPAWRRAAYLASSPAVPAILGAKVARSAGKAAARRGTLLRAAPLLCAFLFAWGAGETRGVWDALWDRP